MYFSSDWISTSLKNQVILTSPSGNESVDLLSEDDVSHSTLEIEIFVKDASLLYFSFSPNEIGFWTLQVSNSGPDFAVNIEATCTFTFNIAYFKELKRK